MVDAQFDMAAWAIFQINCQINSAKTNTIAQLTANGAFRISPRVLLPSGHRHSLPTERGRVLKKLRGVRFALDIGMWRLLAA